MNLLRTSRNLRVAGLGVLLMGTTGLAGCSSFSDAMGLGKSPPDEFAVVQKAPLVIPPDYTLRPPKPGAPRPQELTTSETARRALIGADDEDDDEEGFEGPSQGELVLLRNANADRYDPNIRKVLNEESGQRSQKDEAFADKVIFSDPTYSTEYATAMEESDAIAPAESAQSEQAPQAGTEASIGKKEEKRKGILGRITGTITDIF